MTNFHPPIFQRAAIATLGTLILTTTAVTAAVGPAIEVETAPAVASETQVAGGAGA